MTLSHSFRLARAVVSKHGNIAVPRHIQRGVMSAAGEELPDKILIANRGEIACRVMRTCQALGIKTVAVYSDVDASSVHVQMADEAVFVGPANSAESYLNIDNIMAAIKQTGATAVHPGYGFLSENFHFAERLKQAGVTFIAPNVDAIEAMGDKIESKVIAKNAGVNTIPGFDGEIDDVEKAIEVSNEIGYPVMVKASAGGGGKGMRVAWDDAECREAFTLSKSEALSSFGDDRMLVEKYIDNPRHIEIQVLGDSHGNYIYLAERECSIQRRNQKVVEEAPSMFLDEGTRKAMGEQAVMLCNHVKYNSAGTVEFLVDSQKNFYFLEMNTRLQVEHPVTEYITGVDLVEQMIRVSAGYRLNHKQSDIKINGWAMESRVYAEDPTKMLPCIGNLDRYIQPQDLDGDLSVRVDSGVMEGSEISIYYDPMICKLITYGKDRSTAIAKMKHALDTYYIKGVTHNIPLLRDIISHPRFEAGDINTKFIQDVYPDGFKTSAISAEESSSLMAIATLMNDKIMQRSYEYLGNNVTYNPNSKHTLGHHDNEYVVKLGEDEFRTVLTYGNDGECTVTVGDKTMKLSGHWPVHAPLMEATINGTSLSVQHLGQRTYTMQLGFKGSIYDVRVLTNDQHELYQHMPEPVELDTSLMVMSPMPGQIVAMNVKVGDVVGEGTVVAVVEAMKMQNSLRAACSGKIKSININAGESCSADDIIIEFEHIDS